MNGRTFFQNPRKRGKIHHHRHHHTTTITTYYCALPVSFRATGFLLLKGGHGIFNVRNKIGVCCAHEGETGIGESAQLFTLKNLKVPNPIATQEANPSHWT